MNSIEKLTLLIDQNKKKREELKTKKEELNEKREIVLQRLSKDRSAENQKKLSTITQKLNKISQDLLEVRRINKELQKKRSLAYKGRKSLKELEKIKNTGTTLSSHSIVQYLDRGRGMDIDSIRQEVSSSANTSSGNVSFDSLNDTACNTQNFASFNAPNANSRVYSTDNLTGHLFSLDSSNIEDSEVSDFEVVNYLSSTGSIDISKLEKEIIDEDIEPIINSDELIGSSGTFTNSEGYRLIVRNGVVVTVLPKEEDKKVNKKRKKR